MVPVMNIDKFERFFRERPPVPHLRGDVADPAAGDRAGDDPAGIGLAMAIDPGARIDSIPRRWIAETPTGIALRFGDSQMRWQDLAIAIEACAMTFADADVRTGQRVMIVAENSPALVAYAQSGLVSALTSPTEVGTVKTTVMLPASPAWTSTFKASGQPRSFDLIDQIWLSPALAPRLQGAFIGRRKKLARDGTDHDPAWITLDL